ncbi:MAG: thymidine phosphorylase, partial [Synergistetes bacterium]|nr:thymidine phosphorylase [Synergistota bacterium]
SGGTIDKIESIPGFRTNLSVEEFKSILKKVGAVIAGQTANLAPADKKLYALRDVTATVESIPLIVSSILGKKIASGTDVWIFDVKVGKGAFMKDLEDARELARLLVSISKGMGKKAGALITDMNQPLGRKVGNAVEVEEAIDALKGEGPADLVEVVLSLGVRLSSLAGKPIAREDLIRRFSDGSALEKFKEMIEAQGGDPRVLEKPSLLGRAPNRFVLEAERDGVISSLDAERIGMAIMILGGGRKKKGDDIDRGVGINLLKKEGDRVEKGEPVVEVFYRSQGSLAEALRFLKEAYRISDSYKRRSLIYEELV